MANFGGTRGMAADKLLSAMGGGPDEALPPMPEEMEASEEAPQGMDLEASLAGVEAALGQYPEETAREMRSHVEAIRELGAGGAEGGKLPGSEELPELPTSLPEAAEAAGPKEEMV